LHCSIWMTPRCGGGWGEHCTIQSDEALKADALAHLDLTTICQIQAC
jgi:hypothetical protein